MYENTAKLGAANCTVPTRQPVAAEVAQFAQTLNQRAASLADLVNGKLHPVMTSDYPRECGKPGKDGVEYPPLFSDLRGNLQGIESALDSIECALSRTEL